MFLPRQLNDLPHNRPVRLLIPTYDGSGQAVHPDILRLRGHDPSYALAFTPYPYTDNRFENPSIVVSSDGIRFREEAHGLNPLAPTPPIDHNDDPDLFEDESGYGLLYLETLRPEAQNLVLLRSKDRLTWTRTNLLHFRLRGTSPDPMIVSPALSRRATDYYLYFVNTSSVPNTIEHIVSNRADLWDIGTRKPAAFDVLPFEPWHVDIIEGQEAFFMFITSIEERGNGRPLHELHIARSTDRQHWSLAPQPVFRRMPLGARHLYRCSGLCIEDDLFIYFSYRSRFNEWQIGLIRKRLADLFAVGAG